MTTGNKPKSLFRPVLSMCRPDSHVWLWTGSDLNSKPSPGTRCSCGQYTYAEMHDEMLHAPDEGDDDDRDA